MDQPKSPWPYARVSNIASRTAHIGAISVLVGGHVFSIDSARLIPWLYVTILTGALLLVIEAYPDWRWCCEGRGAIVLAKLLLLCSIPWLWSYRVGVLIAVLVLASVGSHMPKRLRHYSLVERRVIPRP